MTRSPEIPFRGTETTVVEEPRFDKRTAGNWPSPLREAAYQGVLGDIVRALEPETEADPVAVLVQLLVMLGNVIGRNGCFCVGRDTHYLNLFTCLVGRTSKGRKGVSYGEAVAIFRQTDPEWSDHCITSGLSSGEGLIWAIRDPITKRKPRREGGRVVEYVDEIEDHGISDKRLLVVESEMASVLKVMAREGNILSPVVRQAWDGRKLNITTKNSPAVASDPHIGIIGHITMAELLRLLSATESANGFANRIIWLCVRRSKPLPDGGRPVNLDPDVARLKSAVELLKGRPIEFRRDTEAGRLWHRVYERLGAETPGMLGALTGRAEAQVMRLACLYAVADMSSIVRLPHLKAALEVWRYAFQSVRRIFGNALGDPVADTILAFLRNASPESRTKTQITHGLFGRNRSANEINKALGVLSEAHLAGCEKDQSGDGPSVERWHYIGDDDSDDDIDDISPESRDGDVVDVVNVVGHGPLPEKGAVDANLSEERDRGEI